MAKTRRLGTPASTSLSIRLLKELDDERRHIARQLHDATGQHVAALQINLSIVQQEEAKLSPRAAEALAGSIAIAHDCALQLRAISYSLHPPLLDELGLIPALHDAVKEFAARAGVEVALDLPERIPGLSSEARISLYRIVQEGLANIQKHSRSRTAALTIRFDSTSIVLELRDRGRGPSPRTGSGTGIPAMRHRARQIGGRFRIQTGAKGTTLRVTVPRKGLRASAN